MKLIYTTINETKTDIEIDGSLVESQTISEQEEKEILTINIIHHIIKAHATSCHLKLERCSYHLTCNQQNHMEFVIELSGNPKVTAMMILEAHSSILQTVEMELDLFHGVFHIKDKENETQLFFKADASVPKNEYH